MSVPIRILQVSELPADVALDHEVHRYSLTCELREDDVPLLRDDLEKFDFVVGELRWNPAGTRAACEVIGPAGLEAALHKHPNFIFSGDDGTPERAQRA